MIILHNGNQIAEFYKDIDENLSSLLQELKLKEGSVEMKPNTREELNYLRNKKLEELTVEVNSVYLNADELSQTRMSRAIQSTNKNIDWITSDGEVVNLTNENLKEALLKAGKEQTKIFIEFSNLKKEI